MLQMTTPSSSKTNTIHSSHSHPLPSVINSHLIGPSFINQQASMVDTRSSKKRKVEETNLTSAQMLNIGNI